MPDDTDAGWSHLTKSYRRSPSGGRDAYQRFWDAVDRVSVHGAKGIPPLEAEATVRYDFKDGRRVEERTRFGLVQVRDELRIKTSRVVSSSTR
jgi:hypothetical protein